MSATHIKVTIDGNTIMDGDLGQWNEEPPAVAHMLSEVKHNTRNGPWMRTILDLIAKAGMGGGGFSADVRTRADGYDLSVTEGK